ncbi:MAG TPA: VOC family protein [Acidimicrobiia bacterium]|nr:VOC family protein [Acidimicrobiia bacterium]
MTFTIDTVFVWVTDLDRSVAWYREFGIEAGPRHGTWQTMTTDGTTRFGLHQGERQRDDPTAAIAFGVPDLEAEMSRLAGLGIDPVDSEVTDTGAARFITYRDPDGNEVQLLERRT